MKTSRLSRAQLRKIYQLYEVGDINYMQSARMLGVSRNTVKRHIKLLREAQENFPTISLNFKKYFELFDRNSSAASDQFQQLLPELIGANTGCSTVKQLWLTYREHNPEGYCYSQFANYYSQCCKSGFVSAISQKGYQLSLGKDLPQLEIWHIEHPT